MKNITLFYFSTVISLGLTRNKPVFPASVPATSLDTSDSACPSNSLIDKEVRKTKTMLDSETWFRPCDCGGPGWEKIAFYDFSQQKCPLNFTHLYRYFSNKSCQVSDNTIYDTCYGGPVPAFSSLTIPVEGRSYSSVCGRVRGHGGGYAFLKAIDCNYSLEHHYVDGVSLTHGPPDKRRHIWTFAAAWEDGNPGTLYNCGCSNTNMNWTYTTPDDVGQEYFCDSFRQYTEEGGQYDEDDDLWDGKGCGSSSSCCEWNDPPYFCKHLHKTTSEDMEVRLFSVYNYYDSSTNLCTPTVSLIEIFVK